MNNLDTQYIKLLGDVLTNGTQKNDRTGTGTISVSGRMIKHNMQEGFSALTTKKLFFKTMSIELEGFLKGITDKRWYQERNCKIWNQWSNPKTRPEGISAEEWWDLGSIYGAQWRNFNNSGYDQLESVLGQLENNPDSRRMLVSAWNPQVLDEIALPACHFSWQVIKRGEYLDLIWNQRSCDIFLGLPFNISSYGLLLELLCKQFGYKPGELTGFLGDAHIYNNHREQVELQMSRLNDSYDLPKLVISDDFKDVRNFEHTMVKLDDYKHHSVIKGKVSA